MEQNLDVFDFELTDTEMQRIETMDTGGRILTRAVDEDPAET
jgi:diketogulonate reductase-like aldo/keto reductase